MLVAFLHAGQGEADMVRVSNLSKSYGGNDVLTAVSFVVNAGDRLAVIGPNGSGKSTLLRVLAGLEPPDAGHVLRSPPALGVGYLPQGYADRPDLTLEEAIPDLGRRRALEREVARLAGRLGSGETGDEVVDAYAAAVDGLAAAEGAEGRLAGLLDAWGLGEVDPARPVASLSGGEQTRLGLVNLLVQAPDVLLLDEPTNHLDIDGIERLEEWLRAFKGALVLVTHDRALLAAVATSILDLGSGDAGWRFYDGTYTAYLEATERELAQRRAAYGRQERQIRLMREQIRRLKERALRTERRTIDFYYRKRAARVARQAKTVERRLERFLDSGERVEKPQREARLRPDLAASARPGDEVLRVEGVTLQAGGRVLLRDVSFGLRHRERVALVGPNGSGKTTLLRAVMGEVTPTAGRIRLGASVRAGLLAQDQHTLDPERNAVEALRDVATMDEAELRRFLHHYLFTAADVHTPAARLSYGQRARLALARLVLQGVNLLVLDEPTNHLDIPSREAFEGALDRFEGTVLLVTHDRYFVESFASRVLAIEDGTLRDYPLRV
jgi:ATP-binding cassette subfamily F protein 3